MRSFILAPALLATVAMSKPLDKRVYLTVYDQVTQFVTVTLGPNHRPGSSTVATVTVTQGDEPSVTSTPSETTEAPEPTSTKVAVPTTSAAESTEAASTSATAATASVAASSGATDYQSIVLEQHNNHRANHSASALTWSSDLAAIAQTIGESCVYAHNTAEGGGGYGQNIGAGTLPADVGSMITNEMYNGEIGFYPTPYGSDSPDMSNFESWGHFSQIVWKDTTEVGCATVKCGSLANVGSDVQPYFTVCNYKPAGNFAGEYSNVGAPLGKSTVTV